jgi:hypothetical protein
MDAPYGSLCGGCGREEAVEDVADEERLVCVRRVLWPALRAPRKVVVGDYGCSVLFDAASVRVNTILTPRKRWDIPVYPRVADAVGELFLLAPENGARQVWLRN